MSKIIISAETQLKEIIKNAVDIAILNKDLLDSELLNFSVEQPADSSNGDFSTNFCLINAKIFKKSPMDISNIISKYICLDNSMFTTFKVANPGFINFFADKSLFYQIIIDIHIRNKNYGKTNHGNNSKTMIEFVSANPTGPMHIGNARGGALGDCLASILSFSGYDVTKEFYINDSGNQIDKFTLSLEIRYLQLYSQDSNLVMPEDSYHGVDIIQHAKNFAKIYGEYYTKTDSHIRRKKLLEFALPLNIDKLKKDLELYKINYDIWFNESLLYNDTIKKVINLLKEKNLIYEKDGAIWYKSSVLESEKDKDNVLVRENGKYTYFLADIAYHYNKFIERKFDKVINIWGCDHHGHVSRLKSAISDLGIDPNKLDIVLMQLVRLVSMGEVVKVSKRTGKSITLTNLLDEVNVDSARFFFNSKESTTHLEFDLDLAISKSSENPIYYVQYAYARLCSIINNFNKEYNNLVIPKPSIDNLRHLVEEDEIELIRFMGNFTIQIIEICNTYDASKIIKYVIKLASLFHKFYNTCKVNCRDTDVAFARYNLCLSVKILLEIIFDIIKITAFEVM